MQFHTVVNGTKVEIPEALVKRYNCPAPRYTSYPTAPVWTDKFTSKDYFSVLKHLNTLASLTHVSEAGQAQTLKHLSLYFHIPFCEKRCLFCGCSTIVAPHHEIIDRYIETIGKEISIINRHLNTTMPVTQIHLGGGTPTYLSDRQIEKLWGFVVSGFKLHDNAEIGIETAPSVTTIEQLKLLKHLGFNRISLGVQDFSAEVQNAIGRVESFEHTQKLIEESRKLGFKSVNADLVYGLPYQTKKSFKQTIDKIIRLSPDRIACFNFAYLPLLLPHQKKLPKNAMPDVNEKFGIFCQTIEQFSSKGYEFIGMDHFAKKDDELSLAAKNKTLWRNFQGYTTKRGVDLIGFGLTSISDIGNSYAQNEKKLINYYNKIENGRLATIHGWKLTEDDIVRRKIIMDLFCNGVAVVGVVKPAATLIEDGLIQVNGNTIKITPLGRLFIRNIAAVFDSYFKPVEGKFSKTV